MNKSTDPERTLAMSQVQSERESEREREMRGLSAHLTPQRLVDGNGK